MRKFYLLIFILKVFLINAQAPSLQWAKGFGSSNTDMGFCTVTDAAGNVYTTGRFRDTVDFDPGPNTFSIVSSGSEDAYIVKLDASGNFLWAKNFGGSFFDIGMRVAIDGSGNIYISGAFWGTCDFDPGPGILNLTSTGNSDYDVFIAKLNSSGNLIWARNVGSTGFDFAYGLFINPSGEIFITGNFTNTIDLDPGPATVTIATNGIDDVFLLKLNSFGNYLWSATFGSAGKDCGTAVNCDAIGNIYLSGYFQFSVDFDPGPGTTSLTSISGWQDAFILKLDNFGNLIWVKSFGGSANDNILSTKIDQLGNIYTTGYFNNTVDFDPGPGIMNMTSAGLQDDYILKLDPSGNFLWVKSYGSNGNDYGNSISFDLLNNVYSSGNFSGTIDFDPNIGYYPLTAVASDGFITKLDPAGNFLWATKVSGKLDESSTSIAVDASNNILATGYFQDTCDFDPGAGFYNLASKIQSSFILKMVQCTGNSPTVIATTNMSVICVGESSTLTVTGASSYWWSNGITSSVNIISPTITANYIVTGLSSNGCSDTAMVNQVVDACIGLNEFAKNQLDINLFPNPTHDILNLKTRINSEESISIELTDLLGNILFTNKYETNPTDDIIKVNLTEMNPGIYLIIVKNNNEGRTFKLIKD